ncbi:hypothetical protein [Dietzia cercidiphylli]|uniref:DUF8175 domain-containing protein n=1 Tax=Dietzia cercidiphylli TaxID=498199 RepID=A0ABN2J8T4_9ACTN|nr:hypothetical protein [Dietzia cercidiphylli]MBB1047274.1 hypothetical protein [Dietzia cercidiphylli]MDI6872314.1 hypothetical protein [Bacillota bacterium]
MTKKTWITAAAVLVVSLVVLVLVIAMTGRDEETGQAAPAPEPTSAPVVSTPAVQPGRVVSDLVGRQVTVVEVPGGQPLGQSEEAGSFPAGTEQVAAPSGLTLQRVPSGTTLMVSTSDGPTDVEEDVMTGYARSPGGAALLTANYIGLGLEMGPVYADFMQRYAPELVAEEPGLLEELRNRGTAAQGQALRAAEGFQAPRWFRFSHCSPEFCTVDAAMPSVADAVGQVDTIDVSATEHPVVRVSVAWTGEQWEIVSGRSLPALEELDRSWVLWI